MNIFIFLLAIVTIYLCILLPYWINYENALVQSFLNTNIADAVNPIITVVLTIAIAYFINIKFSKKSKLYEVFLELLEDYKTIINSIEIEFNKYSALKNESYKSVGTISDETKKDLSNYESILRKKLKIASQRLFTISKIQNKHSIMTFSYGEDFSHELKRLKQLITDNPFGQAKIYNITLLNQISNSFESIYEKIFIAKVDLYK